MWDGQRDHQIWAYKYCMWLLSVNLSQRKSFQILLSHPISIKKLDYWRSERQPRHSSNRVITNFRKSLQQTVDPDTILGTLFFNNDESKMVCADDQFKYNVKICSIYSSLVITAPQNCLVCPASHCMYIEGCLMILFKLL